MEPQVRGAKSEVATDLNTINNLSESIMTEESRSGLGSHPPAESGISLLDIAVLLVRRWTFLFLVTSGFAALAILLALITAPTYTATTSLLPPQQSGSFASSLLSQLGGLGAIAGSSGIGGLKSPSDLYVGLLKSTTVEEGMVRRFNLQQEYKVQRLSDARKALESHSIIDGNGKDGLIRITVQAKTASRAAELANGYVTQYRELSASLAIGEASQRRLFLEQQLQQTKENLAKAEEDLKRTEQTTGLIQLDSQARALIESASSLRAQIAAKEVQVQSMRTYAGSGNVDLIQAEQELSGLRGQLAKLGGAGEDSELMMSKGKIPQAGLDYVRKLREVKYNETIFDLLARQYEAARLDEAKEGALVQVVDVAMPPDRKSGPPRTLIVVAGTLLGFLAGLAWLISQKVRQSLSNNPHYIKAMNELSMRGR